MWVKIDNKIRICPWFTLILDETVYPSHTITVLPKNRSKRLTQWMRIMQLPSYVGVMFQVRCNTRKAVVEHLSIVQHMKLPRILV